LALIETRTACFAIGQNRVVERERCLSAVIEVRVIDSAMIRTVDSRTCRNADGLWAITSYWNPMRYRRRHANYRLFREHLKLPLLAIELAYGPEFELGHGDAEMLVQLRGRDVLWQKERLLNVALQGLPETCRRVVWIDCDVVFESDDWAERTNALLDRFMLVQPFSHLHWMPPDWEPGHGPRPDAELLWSVPFLIASGTPAGTCLGASQIERAPGYAWAADRQFMAKHRLYDACIIGGGDIAVARAAYGCFEAAVSRQRLHRDHYLSWADPFHNTVRKKVAFVEGNLFHLWHGKSQHRRYYQRHEELSRFQFDPFEDIAIDHNGAWRWNSDKVDMHDYVRGYFESRTEDG